MRFFIISVIVALCPVVAFGATIYVPADYTTIQQAIDAASNGDTILVAPGTYLENIDFLGKAVYLRSEAGAESTVIHSYEYGRLVSFINGEGPDSILEGFTLTNGDGVNFVGGTILCSSTSPTIRYNILTKNISDGGSGIMLCENGSPIIEYNSIHDNDVVPDTWMTGITCVGGEPVITNNEIYYNPGMAIFCSGSAAYIADNNIYGNLSHPGGLGILCQSCSPYIVNNNISGNSGEGGIYCTNDASPTITNNFILGNAGIGAVGGIQCGYNSNPVITNNTIMGNRGIDCPVGGIYCYNDSVPVITNNIIWANEAGKGGNRGQQIYGNPIVTYCDVQDGWPGVGNIDSDPLLWDSRLTFNSPCRGSGDNTAVTELCDFEGDPRIAYGTVDMGADEFYTHLCYKGNATPGGSIQGVFIGLPGTTPVGLFIGSGIRPTPALTPYGEFWLLPPKVLIPLVPIPANGILSIPTTIPMSPPAPYDIPMQGLVGLNSDSLTNLCVLEVR